MGIRTNILLRVYIAFGLILFLASLVTVQLVRVQFVQGARWRKKADSISVREIEVDAARGNIFSADGSLLATSIPEYELHMNMMAPGISDDDDFNERVDSLALQLSRYFGDRSEKDYMRMLREAHTRHSKYLLINRNTVSYADLKKIRQFSMFNLGKYSGGLVPVYKNKRLLPFHSLAQRTIGYKNDNVKNPVGLEGAYADYIKGESGKRLVQYISGNAWMPINDEYEIEPKDGADIISTIDVNLQDVAQRALKKQLDTSAADFGCVVLMEVATGHIKAIANFTRTKDGEYQEKMNYAIAASAEPGSTFKLATYMTLLDQHKIDTSTRVDVEGGKAHVIPNFNKYTVTDAELGGGVISARRAFEESSNVAAAKFVYNHYKDSPSEFTSKLYSYHLNEPLKLQIPGEGEPLIKTPKSRSWSKLTLPQMAYGYEMKMTPLQMLTFYNAVANNGKMIAPIFVSEIRRLGNTVEHFDARVINPQVCSDQTLRKVRGMLEGVVQEGTGKNVIKNQLYTVAGKTGTAQIANGANGYKDKKYQASFCGYFPAESPKYSMIVVITHPTRGAYLAAKVAGPVFRAIADRVYATDLTINQSSKMQQHLVGNTVMPKIKQGNKPALKEVYGALGIKPLLASANAGVDTSNGIPYQEASYKRGTVPTVTGMGLSDALYIMGNAGYKVTVHGSGVVKSQSVTGGSSIPTGSKVTIELE